MLFCTKCGTQNDDNSYKCVKCGEILQQVQAHGPVTQVTIPNYLVQSILVTLCCCLPFGIVSIIYAAQVNTKVKAGDIQGALDYSSKAKMWCWIGFGVGLVANLIIFAIQFLAVLASRSQY
jgi:uncharacterized membrane protein YvbJ